MLFITREDLDAHSVNPDDDQTQQINTNTIDIRYNKTPVWSDATVDVWGLIIILVPILILTPPELW
ncbi:hypothetical protein KAM622c_29300 [Klebsiella quasipneumoniae subsp. quasipneumoniae]|nr:hypothetical protein KAM622c_29300 [Klebsiella quasipneumoniae subsp. quasipneumoniae]